MKPSLLCPYSGRACQEDCRAFLKDFPEKGKDMCTRMENEFRTVNALERAGKGEICADCLSVHSTARCGTPNCDLKEV